MVGALPVEPKALVIAAPHTSNWDGFWALTYKVAIGADIHFFAKHSLFWFPLGTLLRGLGGIPLDRSHATSAVAQAVQMFESNEQFIFGLAPEGTRSLRQGWKSGFHRIATAANVPVYAGVIDFGRKRLGFVGRIELSGDADADIKQFAALYSGVSGYNPENSSPIRFIDEGY